MKFLVTLLIALVTFATADAAKVDIYKAALQNKTFTLKYSVNTFSVRITNRETTLDLSSSFARQIDYTEHFNSDAVNTGGLIVFDNNANYYIESLHDAYTTIKTKKVNGDVTHKKINIPKGGFCFLTKNEETFEFNFEIKNEIRKYKQDKDSNITPYEKMLNEYNYGNPSLYQALQPILPPERVIATSNTPIYKFVSAGNLADGLSYEDFYGEKNNAHYAIRYYFSGDKMTKIATFTYIKNESGVQYYEKHVIDIEEFLTTADENYLQLPANLQDTTKRDKDGGKK